MDPLDAIPPLGFRPLVPAAPARVARVEPDERHPPPGQGRSTGRDRNGEEEEEASTEDLEDVYDENWTERRAAPTPTPEDESGSGPHIDIIA